MGLRAECDDGPFGSCCLAWLLKIVNKDSFESSDKAHKAQVVSDRLRGGADVEERCGRCVFLFVCFLS